MDNNEIFALTAGLPVGSCVETSEATLIVGPESVGVTPTDPYAERYEVALSYA